MFLIASTKCMNPRAIWLRMNQRIIKTTISEAGHEFDALKIYINRLKTLNPYFGFLIFLNGYAKPHPQKFKNRFFESEEDRIFQHITVILFLKTVE